MAEADHKWRFFRSGGFDQVLLDRKEDLLALSQLDQKLWAALSCPAQGLEFDDRTLAVIDGDTDGRIRAPELIAALEWACKMLKDPDCLLDEDEVLPLASIDDSHEEGAELLQSAKQILTNLGKGDVDFITEEDSDDEAEIFAATPFNGDGIITTDATEDEAEKKVIEEILNCAGPVVDRNGAQGISQDKVTLFFDAAKAYETWWRKAEDEGHTILPLGKDTVAAAAAVSKISTKVDDFFTRCRLASFDPQATAPLNPPATHYEALTLTSLSEKAEGVAAFPLAHVEADRMLPLETGVNPAWQKAISDLQELAVKPIFGNREFIDEEQWNHLKEKFAAYESWQQENAGTEVAQLGIDRIREINRSDLRVAITSLVEKDKAFEPTANNIASVDKLVRYHRHLVTLLRNFVSFKAFYSPKDKAIFQVGTLYIDGRSCDLCIKIDDPNKHANLAQLSRTYILYCECVRKGGTEKMNIAAAVTAGDSDNLLVGRNGLFYDRDGNDWDATVIKIVDNPISVVQAFWAPYNRIAKLISDQIEKYVASRTQEMEKNTATGITTIATNQAPAAAAAPSFDVAKFAGIFAAIGLALGAIGTALATIVSTLLSLPWWQIPIVIVGVPLLISGPSMIIAYLKLRKRNLGPILDASGWAVNTKAMLNVKFGRSLTRVAELPEGAECSMSDPFDDGERSWWTYILIIALVAGGIFCWRKGHLKRWYGKIKARGAKPVVEATKAPVATKAP